MIFIDNIDPKLRVGPSCGYMSFSGIYEGKRALYMALGYTHLDFIYNKETFTKFLNPKPVVDYISKENELIIVDDINSKYMMDSNKYLKKFSEVIHDPFESIVELEAEIELRKLKEEYLDKGCPVMYLCDHYYTYNDYKKKTSNILHFHTSGHMVILCDLNFEKNTAYVIDKFYSFKGEISLDNFKKSISSDYLEMKKFSITDFKFNHNLIEKNEFSKCLRENFTMSLKESIIIDQIKYSKNGKAVEAFVSDFKENVTNLYEQKGKYAPQFLSKLVSETILQRISFSNLLSYMLKIDNNEFYSEISDLVNKSKTLWINIDLFNDKFYLKGKNILNELDRYNRVLESILEVEIHLYKYIQNNIRIN